MRWLSCSAARRGCHLGPPEDRRVPHQSDVDVIEPTSPVRAKPAQSSRARTRPSTDMQIHAYDWEESQVRQGSEWLLLGSPVVIACLLSAGAGCIAVSVAGASVNVGIDLHNHCSGPATITDGIIGGTGVAGACIASLGRVADSGLQTYIDAKSAITSEGTNSIGSC